MSMPFYCSKKKTLDRDPTVEELQETGGVYLDGLFYLNNDTQPQKSSSGACKKCLNRNGETNEWQGPEHMFVLIDGQWIKFSQSTLYR